MHRRQMLERELKPQPGPRFRLAELPGLPGRAIEEHVLTSTYHDTDDLRLAAGAVTLRRREQDGEAAVWQLELPRSGDRLEHAWEAPDERLPDEIARLVTAHTRGRPLGAVATLHTRRAGVVFREDGADVAEIVHDIVEVLDEGRPPHEFEELGVELLDGDRRSLRRIEKVLRKAGAESGDGRPKLFQALGLEPPAAPAPSRDGARAALQTVLHAQYEEILRHDPGTRMGDDPEALHDHRVAFRRLRALLRAGRPLLDRRWADDLRGALRRAGRALAEVRDLDVMVADVDHLRRGLPEPERSGASDVVERLRDRRDAAQARLGDELCEAWYISVLNRVEQAVHAPRFAGTGSLEKVVRREHRRARTRVRALPRNPSDAELHAVRKAVKHSRYAAELADAAGIPGMAKYVKRAKDVQDVLGDHQDAVVASEMLAEIDGSLHRPAAHMAVEALRTAYSDRRTAARTAFPRAWRRLDRAA